MYFFKTMMTLNWRSHYSHKSSLRFLLSIILIGLFSLSGSAQSDELSRVKLKSGAQIVGKVIELDPEKGVKLELAGGKQIEISMDHVEEITPISMVTNQPPVSYRRVKERHDWKNKGYYVYGNFGFPLGVDSWGDLRYKISEDTIKYGVGIGLYYDTARTFVAWDAFTKKVQEYCIEIRKNWRNKEYWINKKPYMSTKEYRKAIDLSMQRF